jgi:hypothetical protein
LPSQVKPCLHSPHFPVGSSCPGEQVPTFGAHRGAPNKPPAMAPKRASSKAAPSVDEAAKAALLAEKKGKALADTTHQEACEDDALSKRQRNNQPTPEGTLRTCSSGGQPQEPPLDFAPLEGEDATEDGEVIGIPAEEQLQLRALRIKNHNLQKQKEILEAKRQRVSAQAKVRQMIRDEEQRAQELEQEIALMQHEGQHDLQHGPPLQQRAPVGDLFIPQRGPFIPHATAFQGINYLDERSPLAPQLQVSPWPANFRAGTYPKYNGSTDPAQYIMSYQVVVASSRRDDATMAKSFIIALEGPALTWYTRLPLLSIDSWRTLRDKFLLNFQGYRPDTDALAELSLCKQLEKETLREYYRKFLTLKSQLLSVDDQIAIHYAISGLRAGVLYSHCIRDPPKNLQELYQLFEKYARSEELHQRKVESQRKPKDPPQSSRTWTRPSQSDPGRDSRSQQQVHNIANQHPTGEAPRRQDYPPRAVAMARAIGAGDGRSSRAYIIACFTAKTTRTRRGIARKRRPPRTGCLGHNPPAHTYQHHHPQPYNHGPAQHLPNHAYQHHQEVQVIPPSLLPPHQPNIHHQNHPQAPK